MTLAEELRNAASQMDTGATAGETYKLLKDIARRVETVERERDEFRDEMISSEKRQARLESNLPAPESEFDDPLRGPTASWLDGYVTAAIFEEGKPPIVEVNFLAVGDPDAFAAAIKAAARYTKAGADE
jgi:hypothetical protein